MFFYKNSGVSEHAIQQEFERTKEQARASYETNSQKHCRTRKDVHLYQIDGCLSVVFQTKGKYFKVLCSKAGRRWKELIVRKTIKLVLYNFVART